MPFGQVVIGPPGSGKTTYCAGMQQFLRASNRKVAVINLDPANDDLPYEAAVDISELVALEEVMEHFKLGPNGGLVYCLEYLEKNLDWLFEQLEPLEKDGCYFILDLPGQVELYTLHGGLRRIVDALAAQRHHRLAAVHLVDAHLCTEAPKYLAALLLSLSSMLHLELPAVNVLSKVDLLRQYGGLDFRLDFYTEVQELGHLVAAMAPGPFSERYRKLSAGLADVVQEYGLLAFTPLAIQDRKSVAAVLAAVDKANGAVFGGLAGRSPYPPELLYGCAAGGDQDSAWADMHGRYVEGADDLEGGSGGAGQLGSVVERLPAVVEGEEEEEAQAAAAAPAPAAAAAGQGAHGAQHQQQRSSRQQAGLQAAGVTHQEASAAADAGGG